MGDYWLEVLPEHYVKIQGDLCVYNFRGIWTPFNIIGIPLFLDYYVTHVWSEEDNVPSYLTFA